MTNSLYATSFSLKTLDHLGINLYGNAPAVIAELVANAHDAAARRVDITISPGKILVQDDGVGMSLVDINTKYLRFGYEKRREITTIPISDGERTVERHVMGRKGIGKISALSVAHEIEVQTVQGNEQNGFVLSLDVIRQLQESNSTEYLPTPLPGSAISISQGTRIELRQLVDQVTGLNDTLRVSLARMFPVTGAEVLFDIYVNGTPITIEDRKWFDKVQFIWYFGIDSKKFTTYCPRLESSFLVDDVVELTRGHTISGWLATIFTFSDVDTEQKIVPIYAQNKMIQRDILYDYKNYKLSSAYIIGEIYAPFMDVDTEPDIILTDRQRINPNDPRYVALRKHVVQQVEAIDKVWNSLREESPNRRSRRKRLVETPPIDAHEGNQPSPASDMVTANEGANELASAVPTENEGGAVTTSQDLTTGSTSPQATTTPGVSSPPQAPPRVSEAPPRNPAGVVYTAMEEFIRQSAIEQSFQDRIRADLRESRLCYDNSAFKACVVMLGAVLEGTMLGVLRQPPAVDRIATTTFTRGVENTIGPAIGPPPQRASVARTALAQQMGERLKFEMMRQLVESLVPDLNNLRVDHIQHFRNAIHPWRTITEPAIYGRIDFTRATQYVMSCHTIIEHLTRWQP